MRGDEIGAADRRAVGGGDRGGLTEGARRFEIAVVVVERNQLDRYRPTRRIVRSRSIIPGCSFQVDPLAASLEAGCENSGEGGDDVVDDEFSVRPSLLESLRQDARIIVSEAAAMERAKNTCMVVRASRSWRFGALRM